MWKRSAVLLCPLIAACVTSFSTLDSALPLFRGKNVTEAVRYLGIPSQEYETLGKKVYVWSTTTINPFSSSTTTTTGTVGTKPFSATSTTTGGGGEQLSCTLKLITSNGTIEGYDYEGNNGACFHYSDRLKPLLK